MASSTNVLFVDDSPMFLETFTELCAVLSRQTWQIESAPSVDRARVLLREKPVDLVVLDLGMPQMEAFEFVDVIKRLYPKTKVAVMTGDTTDTRRAEALARGADLFVEKPVTSAGIQSVFQRLNDLIAPCSVAQAHGVTLPADLPESEFVVVATYDGNDGKWNPAKGRNQ